MTTAIRGKCLTPLYESTDILLSFNKVLFTRQTPPTLLSVERKGHEVAVKLLNQIYNYGDGWIGWSCSSSFVLGKAHLIFCRRHRACP